MVSRILHNLILNKTMGISYCNSYCDLHSHLPVRTYYPSSSCRGMLALPSSSEIAVGLRELPHLRFLLPSML